MMKLKEILQAKKDIKKYTKLAKQLDEVKAAFYYYEDIFDSVIDKLSGAAEILECKLQNKPIPETLNYLKDPEE